MDELLDKNDNILFNLISYYYSPKPDPLQLSISHSNSASSSSSPPLQSQNQNQLQQAPKHTLQDKQLCSQIAAYTAMHDSHIFDCFDQIRASTIDTFTINEEQVKTPLNINKIQ